MQERLAPEPIVAKPGLQTQVAVPLALVLDDGQPEQKVASGPLYDPAGHAGAGTRKPDKPHGLDQGD